MISKYRLESALDIASGHLISQMNEDGYWEGRLSSSALSTATAISALALADMESDQDIIRSGAAWLAMTQNPDGGWGDTTDSPSNLATTLLAASALTISVLEQKALESAQAYITARAGETGPERVSAIQRVYGDDRTFAVPILMNCALAGLVPWSDIPGLPFELAIFPQRWYKALRLHVVSYALPALIAVGLAIDHHNPPKNRFVRQFRRLIRPAVLARLAKLQPEHGGFLDATPLTSFVAMSLIPILSSGHRVASKCLRFIKQSQRADGSWPIDTNLSVWVTTGAVSALVRANRIQDIDVEKTKRWIADRQYRHTHQFTGALPGGWGWTHLAGGVPDADDTSGAMIAMSRMGEREALRAGANWLLKLQNSDGGWPTFCRGWGKLPFDKSSPDVTAHALRALSRSDPAGINPARTHAISRGFGYLSSVQRDNGSWLPLWFGNQSAQDHANPVLGTARVLMAWAEISQHTEESITGVQYLLNVQNPDGGWGGDKGVLSSVEETALAVTALTRFTRQDGVRAALSSGVRYLASQVEDGSWAKPAPIGLYFASLWYSEDMYPVIWTVEALSRAVEVLRAEETSGTGVVSC
jgi:squalene-hopene/tetraprenyl-beta-curcumene cyclase